VLGDTLIASMLPRSAILMTCWPSEHRPHWGYRACPTRRAGQVQEQAGGGVSERRRTMSRVLQQMSDAMVDIAEHVRLSLVQLQSPPARYGSWHGVASDG
jgi:hypothetical protein